MARKIVLIVPICVTLLLVSAWQTGWMARTWYQWQMGDVAADSLSRYRVSIDALPLQGITRNASGLTYHAKRHTLFTVINSPPQVAELSTSGEVLRIIPVSGLEDIEGISYIGDDLFVLVGEAEHRLAFVQIDNNTDTLHLDGMPSLSIAIDPRLNAGFEGVSWDNHNERLLVVQEKNPVRILQITGLPAWYRGELLQLNISEWPPAGGVRLLMSDLSSITFHETSGHTILLSDESHLALQLDHQYQPIGLLALRSGKHGLSGHVPQAEGVAMTPEGVLFVVSEPNLFYRFEPPVRASDRNLLPPATGFSPDA